MPSTPSGDYTGHGNELPHDFTGGGTSSGDAGIGAPLLFRRNPRANSAVGSSQPYGVASQAANAFLTPASAAAQSAATEIANSLSLTNQQWQAMIQAFQAELAGEHQLTRGNITAPTLDVGERLYGALLNTGAFTTAQAQQIYYDYIVPALGGGSHLNASPGTILSNLQMALGPLNPSNLPAPPTDGGSSGTTPPTDPNLAGLIGALTTPPTSPTLPQPALYAQPTDGSGSGLWVLLLFAGAGGFIYFWWRERHKHGAARGEAPPSTES